jgi:hypothetical protein
MLVAAPVLLGSLSGCGGGSNTNTNVKALYAQQLRPQGRDAKAAAGVDPDELAGSSVQFFATIASLGGDHYKLTVTNGSDVGFLNTFTWVHPPQMTITAVKGNSTGSCRLVRGDISCSHMAIKPPACTCRAGGTASVLFDAKLAVFKHVKHGIVPTSGGLFGGWLRIGVMTPVPYIIPSYLGPHPVDLPICQKGQQSTKVRLCVHSG